MSKEEYHINLSLQRVLLTGYSSCYIVIILYDVPDSGSLWEVSVMKEISLP